eukprot:1140927-Pelagomonas_calceolata.AAC.5
MCVQVNVCVCTCVCCVCERACADRMMDNACMSVVAFDGGHTGTRQMVDNICMAGVADAQ